jgi:hypothetical protein
MMNDKSINQQNDSADINAEGRSDPLVNAIRKELDRSCDALDGYTLSRLHRMRSAALARPQSRWKSLLLPFGGLVTACALVLVVNLSLRTTGLPTEGAGEAALEDIEILTANESLDLYEDYEFYQWLAEN